MASMTFAVVICDADDPCSVNTAYDPASSFTMSPRSTSLPLYLWNFGSNSEFLRWQMSINDAQCTVLPSFLASVITSFLFLPFVRFHAGIFSSFFIAWGKGINLAQCIHSFSSNMIFIIFVKRSFHALCRRLVGFDNVSVILSCKHPGRYKSSLCSLPLVLHSIAAGIGTSNFLRAFFSLLEVLICWIYGVNAPQFSCIVKLRFFR